MTNHPSIFGEGPPVPPLTDMNARTIDQMPPEGVRTKPEEWEAMYAALFRQMKPIMDENIKLKALPLNDIIEQLDKELIHRYSRCYRAESFEYSDFEKGIDAGISDARQAMIKVLQDYQK